MPHPSSHIHPTGSVGRWRPATSCGRRNAAHGGSLPQRHDQPQPKLGRGNSTTDADWRLPRKEVRRWTNDMTPTLAGHRRNTKAQ